MLEDKKIFENDYIMYEFIFKRQKKMILR